MAGASAKSSTSDFSEVQSSLIELPPSPDGPQKIHIRVAGKPVSPPEPTVIFINGLGSGCLSFTPIQQALADAGYYSVSYDRLGTGRSSSLPRLQDPENPDAERKPAPRLASELATEFLEVVDSAGIKPPFVLVTHSFGGIIAWEILALISSSIVGVIFLDANAPKAIERKLKDPDLVVLTQGLKEGQFDYAEIIGAKAIHRLPPALWKEAMEDGPPPAGFTKGEGGDMAEGTVYEESCRQLGAKDVSSQHPLGEYPVTVIKGFTEGDIWKMIAASERLGGGTKEGRDEISRKLEGADQLEGEMQRQHLALTKTGTKRFVETSRSGHWIHVTESDLVIGEIKLLLQELKQKALLEQWEERK